jgi:hypothetical protein
MSGEFRGAASRITRLYPKCVYVHCYAHRLNLATEAACGVYPQVRDALATIQALSVHVTSSANRNYLFHHCSEESALQLKTFSGTRWLAKKASLQAIIQSYPTIVAYLRIIDQHDKTVTGAAAKGLLNQILNFNFIFIVHVLYNLFCLTNKLSETMQKVDNNVCKAKRSADTTILELTETKTVHFATIYEKCLQICNTYEIQTPIEIESPKRSADVSKRPSKRARLTASDVLENIDAPAIETREYKSFFKTLMNKLVETFISEIESRFHQKNIGPLISIYRNVVLNSELDPDIDFEKEFALYKDEINITDFITELKRWYCFKRTIKTFDPNDFEKLKTEFVQSGADSEFPNIFKLLKIYLSVPIASAECERSFSVLKRILTWLRNTMEQDRLSDLAILNIELPTLMKKEGFDLDKIIDIFASAKARRTDFH